MRAYQGQLSDTQTIKRTLAEKQRQLRELNEILTGMKPHVAPALRQSVRRRIAELQAEPGVQPVSRSTR